MFKPVTDPFTGEGFIGESWDDVEMRVKDVLAADRSDIPAYVVTVRSILLVEKRFDLLQEVIGVLPLLRREVKDGLSMGLGDDHS